MTHHDAHHHHHPGRPHPPAAAPLSLLRFSVVQRLALAAGLIALIWLAAFWAVAT